MLRSNEKKIAVIVQCRLSSTRLPGKALKKLGEKTVLEWTLASMKKVRAGRYFVATDYDSYEELKPYCQKAGFEIYAGSLDDVLDRYCSLINEIKCDYVLRATADNPFLFYEAAQELINEFVKQQKIARCDYMTWSGLPHGSGVEVFIFQLVDFAAIHSIGKVRAEALKVEQLRPAAYLLVGREADVWC